MFEFDRAGYKKHCKRLKHAQQAIMSGNLPVGLKITAHLISSFAAPSHHLEWASVSEVELARRLAGRRWDLGFNAFGVDDRRRRLGVKRW